MPDRTSRLSRSSGSSRSTSPVETQVLEEEEPMRIWSHPICCPSAPSCPSNGSLPCPDRDAVLEQLRCQNQLLVDLLASVNSLTAALLYRPGRGEGPT